MSKHGRRAEATRRGSMPRSEGRAQPRVHHGLSGRARVAGAALGVAAIILFVGVVALFTKTAPTASRTWSDITPDRLATMLQSKDFVLLNVKTPYSGEIAGTDLYIPYDQIMRRAAELPLDKSSRIVVYCRSGHESAMAAQTLLDLGYTNINNLDGGMTAWIDSGRQLITVDRSGG